MPSGTSGRHHMGSWPHASPRSSWHAPRGLSMTCRRAWRTHRPCYTTGNRDALPCADDAKRPARSRRAALQCTTALCRASAALSVQCGKAACTRLSAWCMVSSARHRRLCLPLCCLQPLCPMTRALPAALDPRHCPARRGSSLPLLCVHGVYQHHKRMLIMDQDAGRQTNAHR